jgi:membrane protease YdiL (CAAX protease family)
MGADEKDVSARSPIAAWSAVLIFALLFPSLMTWLYFVVFAKPADQQQANPIMQVIYSGGKVVQFLLPVVAVRLLQGRWPRPSRPHFRGLGLGLLFGLAVGAGILALYFGPLRGTHYLRETPAKLQAKLYEFNLATPAGFLLLGIFISVIHSLFEEYYWRWFVFGSLERLLPLVPALIISAVGFMGHHVIVLAVYFPGRFFALALPLSLCIAAGGIAWAWLYHRSGSIYSPWLSHLLIDTAIMVVGYDLMFNYPM